ncbi:MAG: GIY-YIG nuclease family protein [Verrucomicrobia bacterium]|nr:MAG: GIY-YIG nuclease family protein [Verrucomicrobiota bacterium]
MTSATIKLFLPRGDAKSLRTAEISNWTGKAVAAPRTELDELLAREELDKAGVYILIGNDPLTNAPRAYIGEAEVIRDRLKQHRTLEFWVAAIVFVSKDENLTKAHVRYLESRILAEATQVGRFKLEQNQAGGSKLPESDREDMEVFLARIRQLLPVLGSDILAPIAQPTAKNRRDGVLLCRIKGAEARGQRTANGFVVFQGSTAVLQDRPSAQQRHPFAVTMRKQLLADGTLAEQDGLLRFTKDSEFTSPSTAAAVVHGGGANGLVEWKTKDGKTLKELDEVAEANQRTE